MPRSKPTLAQRHYMNGYAPNSIMAKLSAQERRAIKAKMKKAAEDGAAFERTMLYGSRPRSG